MASIDDLRRAARRRLPKFAFDFIDGGAESEDGLNRNQTDLAAIHLVPRYCRDVSNINTEVELFGKTYAVPFGAAPVGFQNTAWPGTDLALARMAADKRMMLGVSAMASTSLELLAEAAEGFAWFQLYISDDPKVDSGFLDRAATAGYDVLIVTVDVCQPGKRDRDIRNGLQFPLRFTPRVALDLALHPRWSLGTLFSGPPNMANMQEGTLTGLSLVEVQHRFLSGRILWEDLQRLRDRWPGKLLIKGVLHPEDAARAVECGCDGLIVSNHGGRQADYAISSIAALPAVAAAVDGRATVLLDSGVRRGADIVRAKALGASAVMAGRPFAFGAAAGGKSGVSRAFDILETELRYTLGQSGVPNFGDVDQEILSNPA